MLIASETIELTAFLLDKLRIRRTCQWQTARWSSRSHCWCSLLTAVGGWLWCSLFSFFLKLWLFEHLRTLANLRMATSWLTWTRFWFKKSSRCIWTASSHWQRFHCLLNRKPKVPFCSRDVPFQFLCYSYAVPLQFPCSSLAVPVLLLWKAQSVCCSW